MPPRRFRVPLAALLLAVLAALPWIRRTAPPETLPPPASPLINRCPDSNALQISRPGSTQTFAEESVTLRYESTRLAFSLEEMRLGGTSLLGAPSPPTAEGPDVVYRRGGVTERYTPRGVRVEQTFVLDRTLEPLRGDGDLTLRVALRSPLKPRLPARGDRVEFRDAGGRLAMVYGAATAIDAAGRRRKLDYALDGDVLVMTLRRDFVAGAAFPLVVDPTIGLSPTSITFASPEGGPDPIPQEVLLTNTGTDKMKCRTSVSDPWMSARLRGVGQVRPGEEDVIRVEVDARTLASGIYNGTITVSSDDAGNSPQFIDVTLLVSAIAPVPDPALIELDPTSLGVQGAAGGPNPAPRTIQIRNGGGSTLNWTSAVLGGAGVSVNPASGSLEPGALENITASFDVVGAALVDGTYLRTIRISDAAASNSPQDIAVTIEVHAPPAIETEPIQMLFSAGLGGPNPFPQDLRIRNVGGAPLLWSLAVLGGSPWLSVGTTAGSLAPGQSQDVAVIADISGLTDGVYQASLQITAPGAVTKVVSVTLTLDPAPEFELSPRLLLFRTPVGGTPPPRTVTIRNSGGGTLRWSLTDNASWLVATPSSGSLSAGASRVITLSVDTTGLTAGPFLGLVSVVSVDNPGVGSGVAAALLVSPLPQIEVVPDRLDFVSPEGGPNPAGQTVTIRNAGGGTLNWTATAVGAPPWLLMTPAAGALTPGSSQSVTVTVDPAGAALAPGAYTAEFRIADAGAADSPRTLAVELTVTALPVIVRSPKVLFFEVVQGAAAAPAQQVQIGNAGGGTLAWTMSVDPPSANAYVSVVPNNGSLAAGASETVDVSIHPAGLAPGVHVALLRINAGGAFNSPTLVAVSVNVLAGAPEVPVVGYCGAIGPEWLFLLGIPWLLRRRRRAAGLIAGLLVAVGASLASAQDPVRAWIEPAQAAWAESNHKVIDFDQTDVAVHLGVVGFSADYEADPALSGGVSVRVAMPVLSGILWTEARAVGLWLDTHVTALDRDFDVPEETKSTPFFLTLGLDAELMSGDFTLAAMVGVQYGVFNQDSVNDGFAGVLGLRGSLKLSKTMRLALSPKIAIGDNSDYLYFVDLSLEIRF